MRPTVRQWGLPAKAIDFAAFSRLVIWFSAGAASATAAKMALSDALASGIETVVCYIDPGSEHSDNERFITDCEAWYGLPVQRMKSDKYADTWDVFERTKWLNGPDGARCTGVLKKHVREKFELPGDLQVFGFDATEQDRADKFAANHPEVALWCPLIDRGIPKERCFTILANAGIPLPAMYLMGYTNNNCIGCVKGGAGYWNKIRVDFPDTFNRMAEIERRLGAKLCQITTDGKRHHVHLDELPPDAGRYGSESMACGIVCDQPDMFDMPLAVGAP